MSDKQHPHHTRPNIIHTLYTITAMLCPPIIRSERTIFTQILQSKTSSGAPQTCCDKQHATQNIVGNFVFEGLGVAQNSLSLHYNGRCASRHTNVFFLLMRVAL